MPHGAGHIGGHHGGGFHHHHHGGFHYHRHHGHHHHRGSWWWWGGGGPYSPYGGYGYRRRGACWIIIFLIIVVVAVPLSISLSLRYGTDAKDTDTNGEYALTDKVVRTYNSRFCQGLQAKSTSRLKSHAAQSNATLYLLNEHPPLSRTENFSFNVMRNRFTAEGDYWSWNFYLNKGSKAHFNISFEPDSDLFSDVTLYVIKGSKKFSDWKDDPDNLDNIVYSRKFTPQYTYNVSYNVSVSDRYYFAFYSGRYSRLWMDISFKFERTVYDIPQDSIVKDCTIPLDGYSSCSIGVPMSSDYTALLSLNTSEPVDYTDGADVQISCQPRAWLYAVIVVCTILPVATVIILVIVCACVAVKRGRNKYTPLVGSNEQTAKDAFEDSANVTAPIARPSVQVVTTGGGGATAPTANLPAFNPGYPPPPHAQAGGYGTVPPPPTYVPE